MTCLNCTFASWMRHLDPCLECWQEPDTTCLVGAKSSKNEDMGFVRNCVAAIYCLAFSCTGGIIDGIIDGIYTVT